MTYVLLLAILFFLFTLWFPYSILSRTAGFLDSSPKALTIHSDSITTIHGDVVSERPDAYVWEFLQNGIWVAAPGLNNAPDYRTCPLLKVSDHNNTVKLRRRILTSRSSEYDSYHRVKVKSNNR